MNESYEKFEKKERKWNVGIIYGVTMEYVKLNSGQMKNQKEERNNLLNSYEPTSIYNSHQNATCSVSKRHSILLLMTWYFIWLLHAAHCTHLSCIPMHTSAPSTIYAHCSQWAEHNAQTVNLLTNIPIWKTNKNNVVPISEKYEFLSVLLGASADDNHSNSYFWFYHYIHFAMAQS